MKRSITRWITTLSTAAALGVPAMALAQTPEPQAPPQQQTPPPQQPPAQPQPTEQPAAPAAAQPDADKAVTPQEHLSEAKAALEKIPAASLTGRARTQVADLKRHLTALERAASAKTAGSAQGTPAAANASWGTDAAAMDKILTDLLGADSATGTSGTTGTPGATGSAGTSRSKTATAVALDQATRAALMDVRKHIVAFATGMSGAVTPKEPAPKSDAAMTPTEQSPATPAEQTRTTVEQQPTTTPEQPATAQAPQAAPATAATAQPQGEQDARRHLTAARDTLNQLTQLPAAAQLAGENRAQVTQLIANFNELMTTQAQWRASYDKVATNLTALLGPDNAGTTAAATTAVSPPATGSTAAPGAVGTSGAATAELDPAVRAKLVELRSNLTEFQKAMGGPTK